METQGKSIRITVRIKIDKTDFVMGNYHKVVIIQCKSFTKYLIEGS